MCFSFAWVIHLLIWLVVIGAALALLRLAVRFMLPMFEMPPGLVEFVIAAIRIVIWAIVAIAVLIFLGDLIACLAPAFSFPRVHV